jgi:hypothetical protein
LKQIIFFARSLIKNHSLPVAQTKKAMGDKELPMAFYLEKNVYGAEQNSPLVVSQHHPFPNLFTSPFIILFFPLKIPD